MFILLYTNSNMQLTDVNLLGINFENIHIIIKFIKYSQPNYLFHEVTEEVWP